MSRLEMAFIGEVKEANCECHEGQFFVGVFALDVDGKFPIGHEFFPDEKTANENAQITVEILARKWLLTMNVDIEKDIENVTVSRGEQALKLATKSFRENNQNLH